MVLNNNQMMLLRHFFYLQEVESSTKLTHFRQSLSTLNIIADIMMLKRTFRFWTTVMLNNKCHMLSISWDENFLHAYALPETAMVRQRRISINCLLCHRNDVDCKGHHLGSWRTWESPFWRVWHFYVEQGTCTHRSLRRSHVSPCTP